MKIFTVIAVILLLAGCSTDVDEKDLPAFEPVLQYNDIEEGTILNLYDAFGRESGELVKDFGFSCILNYNGKVILFDSGSNADIFKQNTDVLGIDLTSVDFVIASHSHFDHINGFDHLLRINPGVKIFFPFDPFWGSNFEFDLEGKEPAIADSLEEHMRYFDGHHHNYKFNQTGRFWNANVEFIRNDTVIAPGISLIATSSPYMGYFSKYPSIGIKDEVVPDNKNSDAKFIELGELSLSLNTPDGEVLIVGCSHSTVEAIIEDSKKVTGNEISLVYGGYHLLPYERPELESLAVRLRDSLGVKRIAPAHCTGHLAFKILRDTFGDNYLFAGLGEKINYLIN